MARIAHFIDSLDSGGAERVVVELAKHLPAWGHEVEVLHFGNAWIESQCREHGIPATALPRRWYRSKWTLGGFLARFVGILRRHRIELLHSHLYGAVTAGALAAVGAGIPHVGTLHDVYSVQERPSRFRLLRVAALLGTQLVAVSDAMLRYYRELGSDTVFERIYNGADPDAAPIGRRRKDDVFTIVSLGRLVPIKGFDVLLQAMRHTPDSVRLRVLGEGPEKDALESMRDSLGLSRRVEFLGFCEDVCAVLADADAFVLASHSEGLSCSILEAMAVSLPCVVTDVGGNRELIHDGENGYVVADGDVNALADRVTKLSCDVMHARSMGEAGRARVKKYFSLEKTVRDYEELYRGLLPLR